MSGGREENPAHHVMKVACASRKFRMRAFESRKQRELTVFQLPRMKTAKPLCVARSAPQEEKDEGERLTKKRIRVHINSAYHAA